MNIIIFDYLLSSNCLMYWKGTFMETPFSRVEKTIFSDIIFEILPFRVHNHFLIVQEVIMNRKNALFVLGFMLGKKLYLIFVMWHCLFALIFFPVSIAEDVMLTIALPLFIHYHCILYSNKHQNILKSNNKNIGVFYYDYINSPFMLYKFYLEVNCWIICNNIDKKVLGKLISDFEGDNC